MSPRIVPRKIDVAGVRRSLDVRRAVHDRVAASTTKLHPPEGAEAGTVAAPPTSPAPGEHRGETPAGAQQDDHPAPIRVVVLGESTAAGIGCDDADQTLAAQLAGLLSAREQRPATWRALGADGATIDVVTTRLVDGLGHDPVDVVALAVGVNDLIGGGRLAAVARDLEALVNRVRGLQPGAQVVLSGLPDPRAMPLLPRPVAAVLARRAADIDERIEATARRHRLAYVPVRDVPLDADHLAADGFHPGPAGYRLWAEHLAAAIPPLGQPESQTRSS